MKTKNKLLPLLLLTFAANAFAALDTPTEDFIDNNDGTVLHKKTGLSWQRCSVGQTWTGSSCSGTASTMNWNDAMASYGNKTDCNQWRLPKIDELKSIVEHSVTEPAINSIIFPNTPVYLSSNVRFWSSTINASNANWVWMIDSPYGSAGYIDKYWSNNNAVRLTRGGSSCNSDSYTPTSDFVNSGNGIVTHVKTGLMWQQCPFGQSWSGTNCTGTISNMNYENAKKLSDSLGGFNDWRLPTISELSTIIEYKNSSPSLNTSIFGLVNGMPYFRTATIQNGGFNTWVLNFDSGDEGFGSVQETAYPFHLVRGSWKNVVESSTTVMPTTPVISTTIDLSSTLSASSSRVKINENLTYTATIINNGAGAANNSSLKIYLPPRNVSVVSMPSDCVTTGKSITCSLGSLAAGANVSRAVTVTYTKSGGASVSSLVLTDSNDTNSTNNVGRVVTAITK